MLKYCSYVCSNCGQKGFQGRYCKRCGRRQDVPSHQAKQNNKQIDSSSQKEPWNSHGDAQKKKRENFLSEIKTEVRNGKNTAFPAPSKRENKTIISKRNAASENKNIVEKDDGIEDNIGDDTLERNIERELEGLRLLLEKYSPIKNVEKIDRLKQLELVNRISEPASPVRSVGNINPHKLQIKKNFGKPDNGKIHPVKSISAIPESNAVVQHSNHERVKNISKKKEMQQCLLIITPDPIHGEQVDVRNISENNSSPNSHQSSQLSSKKASNQKSPRAVLAPPPLPVEMARAMQAAEIKNPPVNRIFLNIKSIEKQSSDKKIVADIASSKFPQIQSKRLEYIPDNQPLNSRRSKVLADKRREGSTMSAPPTSNSRRDELKAGVEGYSTNTSRDDNLPEVKNQQRARIDTKIVKQARQNIK